MLSRLYEIRTVVMSYGVNKSSVWDRHYIDVTMSEMASQIISLPIVYSTAYIGADERKHQSSAPLAFVRGIHRWIPRTNGQERGKCFHLMTSSCRHRAAHGTYTRACPCWVSATTAPIHINLKYLKWHCLIENIIFVYPLDQIAFWQSATCDTSNTYGKRFNKISNHPNNSSPFEFFTIGSNIS